MADSIPTKRNDETTYTAEQMAEHDRREAAAKIVNNAMPNPREESAEGPRPAVPPPNVPPIGASASATAPIETVVGETE